MRKASRASTRRVMITGIGMLCSVGIGTEPAWEAIRAGKSGIRKITRFDTSNIPCKMAAEIEEFEPEQYIERKEVRRMGRFIQLAVAATDMALENSGLKIQTDNAERVGVYLGSGIGGMDIVEREYRTWLEKGPSRVSPLLIPACVINLASGYVSIRTGAKGPNLAVGTACSTSAHAIGESYRIIKSGAADVMIAGGSESAISPLFLSGFCRMKALSTRNEDPEHACRPWDKGRDGFVMGEGAGVLILEELGSAQRRGAKIIAELAGYAATGDAFHITAPPTDGDGAFRAMRDAMRDAGIEPSQVQYVNAHATSTDVGDVIETVAIKRAFCCHSYNLAISSTKSIMGHGLGAAGALEAAITALAIRDSVAPPTMNLENPEDGCDLDYVPGKARPMPIQYAVSNSFGFGGTNASLVLGRYNGNGNGKRNGSRNGTRHANGNGAHSAA